MPQHRGGDRPCGSSRVLQPGCTAQGAKLDDLAIADGYSQDRCGLSNRIAAEEAQLEDAAIAFWEGGQERRNPRSVVSRISVGMGEGGGQQILVDIGNGKLRALIPQIREEASGRGQEVCPHLAFGRVAPQAWQCPEKHLRADVLGILAIAGSGDNEPVDPVHLPSVDGLPIVPAQGFHRAGGDDVEGGPRVIRHVTHPIQQPVTVGRDALAPFHNDGVNLEPTDGVAVDGLPSESAVRDFLADHFGVHPKTITHLGSGEWSDAYALSTQGRDLVARFSRLREDFAKDHRAASFASPRLPVPAVVEVAEALGVFYAVSERASGGFLDDLDQPGLLATLPSLLAALDAMREADVAGTSGWGIWDQDGVAPHASWPAFLLDVAVDRPGDRISGWRRRLMREPDLASAFEAGLAHLERLAEAYTGPRHLVHSDLLNRNVLVSGESVSAIIDWGCALYGDFLYDIAWLTFWAPWFPGLRTIDVDREVREHYRRAGVDAPHWDERLLCCQIHIGLSAQVYSIFRGRLPAALAAAERTVALRRGG